MRARLLRSRWSLVSLIAAGTAAAQAPPPDPPTCVPGYFTARFGSLDMPVPAGLEGTACLDADPARPFNRISCYAGQINETEHIDIPVPHQCVGVGPADVDHCESVAGFSILSAGWRRTEGGWSYCVTAVNRHPVDYRYFRIFAD